MSDVELLKQVWLQGGLIKSPSLISHEEYSEELQQLRSSLLKSCAYWPHKYDLLSSPLPIVVSEELTDHIEKLANILSRAIVNIVERWWIDTKANFPGRMPVASHQEEILRWMEGPGEGIVKPFGEIQGVWRPDFLLAKGNTKNSVSSVEQLKICEINARFIFNCFLGAAFNNEAFEKKGLDAFGLRSDAKHEKILNAFESLLDPAKPLHLLKGTESGWDIHLFKWYLENRRRITVRFITPEDLQLVADPQSGRNILYCKMKPSTTKYEDIPANSFLAPNGEVLERIHQVMLELHQSELESLCPYHDMMTALAPLCINDFRAIYLVHDKRMLGIVLQELDSLVHEHNVLTEKEATILKNGIASTILPGTPEMARLVFNLQNGSESKDDYLLKPIGGGKGIGIVFGSDVSTEDMVKSFRKLLEPNMGSTNYVVQRIVEQAKYDVIIPQNDTRSEVLHQTFVGTFMMINGENLGIAGWRTSSQRICALSKGGAWIPSLVIPREWGARNALSIPEASLCGELNPRDVVWVRKLESRKDGILVLDFELEDPNDHSFVGLHVSPADRYGGKKISILPRPKTIEQDPESFQDLSSLKSNLTTSVAPRQITPAEAPVKVTEPWYPYHSRRRYSNPNHLENIFHCGESVLKNRTGRLALPMPAVAIHVISHSR